jgi:hypothetical protein
MPQLPVDHNLLIETDQQQGNSGYEENVDERTHRKSAHQPQQPQHYQYNSNRPKHVILLSDYSFPFQAFASPFQTALMISSMTTIHLWMR